MASRHVWNHGLASAGDVQRLTWAELADLVQGMADQLEAAGIGGMLVPWLLTGFRLLLHQPFDLPTFLAQVAAERATYTVAPPPLLNLLLRSEELLAQCDLSSVRAIIARPSRPLER